MDYTYSVVIPHHNIPDLLKRCIDSIPFRDDVQIIVVDDTSDAVSVEKVRHMEAEYGGKVEFHYSRAGKGGGAARNLGISKARGRFLMFVDADDFLLPSMDSLFDKYKESEADVVYFNAIAVDSVTGRPSSRVDHLRRMFAEESDDAGKGEGLFRYMFGEPWCKFVKKHLIEEHHIRFDEISIHNDTRFSYLVGFHAGKIVIDSVEAYCLTDRSGSVSKLISYDKLRIRMEVFSRKNDFLRKNNIPYFDHMIFAPVVIALKSFNLSEFFKDMSIAASNHISAVTLIREYLKYRKSLKYRKR